MTDKAFVIILYSIVGLIMALLVPALDGMRSFSNRLEAPKLPLGEPRWVALVICSLAMILLSRLFQFLPLQYIIGSLLGTSLVVANAGVFRWRNASAIFLGLLIITFMPWWLYQANKQFLIEDNSLLLMLAITLVSYWMLTQSDSDPMKVESASWKPWRALIYCVFIIVLCVMVLSTGPSLVATNGALWHHWGAYIGPAQLISAGALPLHDIPLQYGLGPSLLLALSCTRSCWTAMYWATGSATIVMVLLIARVALQFHRIKHPLVVTATLLIVLASCILWTAYPPELNSTLATPSTSGLRFLPGVLMLTWTVECVRGQRLKGSSIWWGHLLWLACILWSPEAALHATAVWVPYYIWEHTFSDVSVGHAKRFVRASVIITLVLFVGLSLSALVYRMAFGEWLFVSEYLAYIQHPPGLLPINFAGPIWYFVTCVVCWFGVWAFARDYPATSDQKASWLVMLFCLAAFPYYLGRSHDNNILNLMPYMALSLITMRAISIPGGIRALVTVLLAAILGWVATFGSTNFVAAYRQDRLLKFSSQELIDSFGRDVDGGLSSIIPLARAMQLQPEDAIPALKYIRSTYHESVEIFDPFLLIDRSEIYPPWSAFHGLANYFFIPSEKRRSYLARVAKRLGKSGWILYEKNMDINRFLADYDSVYTRTHELDFESYRAIRYKPK